MVLAHLKTVATRGNPAERLGWKLRIVTGLYEQGLPDAELRRVFRVVDWLMRLGEPFKATFWRRFQAYQETKMVHYITETEQLMYDEVAERVATQVSRSKTLALLERLLRRQHGDDGVRFVQERGEIGSQETLDRVFDAAVDGASLDELRATWTD